MRPIRPWSNATAPSSARLAGGEPSNPTTMFRNPPGDAAVVTVITLAPDRHGRQEYSITKGTCGPREARVKFDLLGLEDPVRREVLAVAAWRRFDRGVVLFHE